MHGHLFRFVRPIPAVHLCGYIDVLFQLQVLNGRIRIALIGQSQFAVEVYRILRQKHDIVGVFTIPDVNGRPDPLGM